HPGILRRRAAGNRPAGIEGMVLLRQMVLARIFPTMSPEERLQHQEDIFDSPDSLDRLCRVSGGHARNLLRLLNSWISEFELPLQRETLETVIRLRRSEAQRPGFPFIGCILPTREELSASILLHTQ
ncbi:MAG: hypothetical protein IGR76_02080, partial [Synechococcales cyanobacterium T60_A2020_003]|nr:hypothetical protein [Synechococcales cyanobacterium T60_A2020_003]